MLKVGIAGDWTTQEFGSLFKSIQVFHRISSVPLTQSILLETTRPYIRGLNPRDQAAAELLDAAFRLMGREPVVHFATAGRRLDEQMAFSEVAGYTRVRPDSRFGPRVVVDSPSSLAHNLSIDILMRIYPVQPAKPIGYRQLEVHSVNYSSPGAAIFKWLGEAGPSLAKFLGRLIGIVREREHGPTAQKRQELDIILKTLKIEQAVQQLGASKVENARQLLQLHNEYIKDDEECATMARELFKTMLGEQERLARLIADNKIVDISYDPEAEISGTKGY